MGTYVSVRFDDLVFLDAPDADVVLDTSVERGGRVLFPVRKNRILLYEPPLVLLSL